MSSSQKKTERGYCMYFRKPDDAPPAACPVRSPVKSGYAMFEIVFWFSLVLIFYAYFGYPCMLLLVSLFRKHPVNKGDITPGVSFIIAAFNEEKRIRQKIENTLAQDYPKDRLEVIVASDCSTDSTDEIVNAYSGQGVKLVRARERKGKESAQKYAVDSAAGQVLVFSDVATILESNGISNIVKN